MATTARRPVGTVTFLLTDIEGSTRAWETDPQAMRLALAQHDRILSEVIEHHRGFVLTERGEGDSFFAIFERAGDAIDAALGIQLALQDEPWPTQDPIRVRMSLHTGVAQEDHRGPDVNRCARIRSLAHGGQVLVSEATREAAAPPIGRDLIDLGSHRLKDLARPERIYQLAHPRLEAEFPPLPSLDTFRHNLPVQSSSFVGRESELDELRGLTVTERLVTLIGPGGSGKTRLALQVASEIIERFGDGVRFVALGPIADPVQVVPAVAAAFDVNEEKGRTLEASLVEAVRGRELLLILDNCEHLVDSVSRLVDRLSQASAGMHVLATSREALRLPGEVEYRLAPLALPADATSLADLRRSEAVRLFVERARAVRRDFELTETNAVLVASVCRRLDGIPLAIELAAARLRSLSLEDVHGRLQDRFRLLAGGARSAEPRQQTLRGAIDWSHDLLSDAERKVLRSCAVFAGWFDLEAAEALCARGDIEVDRVFDLVTSLVDKSLVAADPTVQGSTRYRLHETLREYGEERLRGAGEDGDARDRHLFYFVRLGERGHEEHVERTTVWLRRLDEARPDLDAALEWAAQRHRDAHLRLAGALAWYWSMRGELRRGRAELTRSLHGRSDTTPAMARALCGLALLAGLAGDVESAHEAADRSFEISRARGDLRGTAAALEARGYASFFGGDPAGAAETLRAALREQEGSGDAALVNRARLALCQALVALGEVEEVERVASEAAERAREGGRTWEEAEAQHFLGDCALQREEPRAAIEAYTRSIRLGAEVGDAASAAFNLEGVAMALAGLGHAEKAIRLEGAALEVQRAIGTADEGFWQALRDRWLAPARSSLGDGGAETALSEGRELSLDEAIAYALDRTSDDAT